MLSVVGALVKSDVAWWRGMRLGFQDVDGCIWMRRQRQSGFWVGSWFEFRLRLMERKGACGTPGEVFSCRVLQFGIIVVALGGMGFFMRILESVSCARGWLCAGGGCSVI